MRALGSGALVADTTLASTALPAEHAEPHVPSRATCQILDALAPLCLPFRELRERTVGSAP
jgi:hypothetical protein